MAVQDDFISLGYIRKPHGYKGALNASIHAAGFNAAKIKKVFLGLDGRLVPFFLQKLEHKNKGHLVLYLDGIDSELEAQKLVGKELFISPQDLPKTIKPVFHPKQLIGFQLYNADHQIIGEIMDVLETAAHPVVKILYHTRQILIPVHPDLIIDLNISQKNITLVIPEGLLEI